MKLKQYLSDQLSLILFFVVLMALITAVLILDPASRVWQYNILYINLIAFFLFALYLAVIYMLKSKYFTQLQNSLTRGKASNESLPPPRSHEQKLFHQLLTQTRQQQNARIEKINSEKKENFEFVSAWVHEIKLPIAVINLSIENSAGKDRDELLFSIQQETDRIDRLVEQVLYYSKIDDFSKDYFVQEMELKALVNQAIKKHASTFIHKSVRLETGFIDLQITSDKKWLLFILDQIISNALKYMDQGGKITIYAEEDEREKRLIITDNGIGIRPEDLSRIFERGFTGYNGREYPKSTGMGLYLAKKLALKLGHDLSADSVYGEYSRLTIHFPRLGDYHRMTRD